MTFARIAMVTFVLVWGASNWSPGRAWTGAAAPTGEEMESDPIRCGWRTGSGAVRIGEQFLLTISCGVKETAGMRVVPVESQFEPTVLPVAPFEVTRRERHDDVAAGGWRYFQYDYTLRLVSDAYFGKDVDIPSIKITYHVQAPSTGESEGRDHTYELPAIPIRILSTVPARASDIRDGAGVRFADAESRRLRAAIALVASAISFAFAIALVGAAAARVTGRRWPRAKTGARGLSWWTMLRACLRSLAAVEEEVARGGWTPERAARALGALRIAGAAALDRPTAQALVDHSHPERQGQLVVRTRTVRGKRTVVSASTTAAMIHDHLTSANGARPDPAAQATLEGLRDSLRAFDVARYARSGPLDSAALDAALRDGTEAVGRVRLMKLWPKGLRTRVL